MALIVITIAFIAAMMAIMAVGAIVKGRCLRGSCGGPEIFDSEGESLTCRACPRRKEHEEMQARAEARQPLASEQEEEEPVAAGRQ